MRIGLGRATSCVGIAALAIGLLGSVSDPAGATPSNAVSWGCFNVPVSGCPGASFSGYATGSELHLSALTEGTKQVADLDQGFSGATTSSSGLTKVINSETGSLVQPAEAASNHAYATGSGFELGVGTDTLPTTDQNQVKLAGRFQTVAPPNATVNPVQIGPVNLSPVATASLLTGSGNAIYDNEVCPLGQPLSYGMGNAANAQALFAGSTPVLSTAGTGTSVAQTASQTFLSSNGDGTFGLTTQASDIIAPVSANIPGGLALKVLVQGNGGVNDPVTLTAKTTGESTGATLAFSSDDILKIQLGTATVLDIKLTDIGPGGLHVPLSTSTLASTLTAIDGAASNLANTLPAVGPTVSSVLSGASGVLSTVGATASQVTNGVAVLNLGYLDIDTAPHVIGAPATDLARPTGGTSAAGSLDLIHLHLALSGTIGSTTIPTTQLADFSVGHLQTVSTLSNPIVCNIPVVKASDPTAVHAGQSFVYNIEVPDPAKLGLIACDLDNITVTDTITDLQGSPTFSVNSAKDTATGQAGTINQVSPTKAIVTWTGLSYKVARSGPPNAPIPLTIAITVPATSPAGVITDTVVAVGTAANCTGGASASTSAATGAAGAVLTGTFTLNQPGVAVASSAPGGATELPHTGGMGGLWQPIGGLAVLGIGGGALALVRRARRLQNR